MVVVASGHSSARLYGRRSEFRRVAIDRGPRHAHHLGDVGGGDALASQAARLGGGSVVDLPWPTPLAPVGGHAATHPSAPCCRPGSQKRRVVERVSRPRSSRTSGCRTHANPTPPLPPRRQRVAMRTHTGTPPSRVRLDRSHRRRSPGPDVAVRSSWPADDVTIEARDFPRMPTPINDQLSRPSHVGKP